eukprot:3195709-Rhodomonas_salina.2
MLRWRRLGLLFVGIYFILVQVLSSVSDKISFSWVRGGCPDGDPLDRHRHVRPGATLLLDADDDDDSDQGCCSTLQYVSVFVFVVVDGVERQFLALEVREGCGRAWHDQRLGLIPDVVGEHSVRFRMWTSWRSTPALRAPSSTTSTLAAQPLTLSRLNAEPIAGQRSTLTPTAQIQELWQCPFVVFQLEAHSACDVVCADVQRRSTTTTSSTCTSLSSPRSLRPQSSACARPTAALERTSPTSRKCQLIIEVWTCPTKEAQESNNKTKDETTAFCLQILALARFATASTRLEPLVCRVTAYSAHPLTRTPPPLARSHLLSSYHTQPRSSSPPRHQICGDPATAERCRWACCALSARSSQARLCAGTDLTPLAINSALTPRTLSRPISPGILVVDSR